MDRHPFIQREGSPLTYTRNNEDLHNITSVKSTLKIPHRHNSAISIRIKGHDLQDQLAYFISNQHTKKGPYPIAMKHYNWVKDEINKLLDVKVLGSSHSRWSAPTIVVPKGNGGKCLVVYYKVLNKVTQKFIWPMSKVEDIFSKLNGAKYFSTLDL